MRRAQFAQGQFQAADDNTGVPGASAAYGAAVTGLLGDRQRAARIGINARERVRERFTSPRSLLDYVDVIARVLGHARARAIA